MDLTDLVKTRAFRPPLPKNSGGPQIIGSRSVSVGCLSEPLQGGSPFAGVPEPLPPALRPRCSRLALGSESSASLLLITFTSGTTNSGSEGV
ncbi:hypothetical protein JZ751_010468 [Albula glossodonta]|uniref:Uncharacterized protein n=1 Tax=Albula glossodonta TaxID=121402 RepID=A0A8T2P072_9TELE|nr:hypothetical protein JZ751_010468 [Albula glossodonta]